MEKNLEEYESVRKWLIELSHDRSGSQSTKRLYLRCLQEWCEWTGKNPDQLIAERREQVKSEEPEIRNKVEEEVKRWFDHLLKLGVSRITAKIKAIGVRSFYKYNYYRLQSTTPRAIGMRRRPPSIEEIKLLYDHANVLDRAIIMVAKDSGISREDLIQLTYGDIQREFEAKTIPIHVHLMRTKEGIYTIPISIYERKIGKTKHKLTIEVTQ